MDRKRIGIVDVGVLALAIVVAVIAIGVGGRASPHRASSTAATARIVAQVAPIARRVEQIRGLRFKSIPHPAVVTPAQTRALTLGDLDHDYPPARRRDDAELLELLGLVPTGTNLRTVLGDVSSDQVAGFYDPKRKRLAVVSGPGLDDPVIAEITLAHELTHALEDQRFGLDEPKSAAADDASTARTALLEGTATSVMSDYARRFIPPGSALASAIGSLGAAQKGLGDIPPYLQRSLEFSYTGGQAFVERLRAVAHGWKLVNYALRSRPPVSSEQIMHPDKYLAGERPLGVTIAPPRLGAGWRRAARGTLGEFDTRELVKLGAGDAMATEAAAGWGGGAYELWTRPPGRGCAAPCRTADALVLRWRWDTPADAREFDAALPLYVTRGLHGVYAGPYRWRVGAGGAAIGISTHGATTLVLAPTPMLASRLARGQSRTSG